MFHTKLGSFRNNLHEMLFYFSGKIKKIPLKLGHEISCKLSPLSQILFSGKKKKKNKLEMCPQYTDAPAVGYPTIKLQNSIWYKCLNSSLTESRTYICKYIRTHIRTEGRTFVRRYAHTENRKTICPRHHPMRGHKNSVTFAAILLSMPSINLGLLCSLTEVIV